MTGPTPSRFDGRAELREAVHEEHEEFYDLREGGVSLTREVRETLHAEESECEGLAAQLSQKSKECEAAQTLLRAREVEVAQMEAKLEANNAKWEGRDLKAQVSRLEEQIWKLESQLKCKDDAIALLSSSVVGAGRSERTPVWLAVACFVAMLACWALWSGPSEVAPRELSGSHAEYFSTLMAARGIISSQSKRVEATQKVTDTYTHPANIWSQWTSEEAPPAATVEPDICMEQTKLSVSSCVRRVRKPENQVRLLHTGGVLSRVLVDVVRLSLLPSAIFIANEDRTRMWRLCLTNIIFCAGDFLFELFVHYDQWQYPWLVVAVKATGHFLAYLTFVVPTTSLTHNPIFVMRDGLSTVLLVCCFLYTLDALWWAASQWG